MGKLVAILENIVYNVSRIEGVLMKKLDNKGFAITGILYTLFILFILLMFSILNGLQSKKQMLEKSTEKLETSYKLKDVTNDSNVGITKAIEQGKALITGKYTFEVNTNNMPIQGLNQTSGYVTAETGKVKYQINEKKEVTVTALTSDSYGFLEGATVYLESGKTYYFSCETNGVWASRRGDSSNDSVEVYISSSTNAQASDWVCMSDWCQNKQKIQGVNQSGFYYIRLGVNRQGRTYTFKNFSITSDDGNATAFTYLAKDSSLDKNQMNFIPNDWNDYKGNYDFKLIKVEKFESGE